MEITQETSPGRDLYHGHTTVGTEAVQLCLNFPTRRGVLVRADDSNTAHVWIGKASVTANTGVSGGMPLPPGQAIVIPVDDPATLFCVSTDIGQDIAWMGV